MARSQTTQVSVVAPNTATRSPGFSPSAIRPAETF
jgi:hypothetical protein